MKRRWLVFLVLAVAIGIAIPVVLGGKDMIYHLGRLPVGSLFGMVLIVFVCWNLNAWRLRLMLNGRAKDFGHGAALAVTIAVEGTINATPGGSGTPFAIAALLRRHNVPPATATAVLAVDQLTDMVVFVVLLPTVALYGLAHYLDLGGWWQMAVPLLLVVAVLAAALWVARHDRLMIALVSGALDRLPLRWARHFVLARSLLRFRRAIRDTLMVPWPRLAALFLLCLVQWLLRYSILYLAIWALGHHIGWSYGFFVQMVAKGAGHLTLLPGGAGGAEVAGAALLQPWLGSVVTATAILVWRFMTFYLYLIVGGTMLLILLGRSK